MFSRTLLSRSLLLRRSFASTSASAAPHSLLFIEHRGGQIESGTLSALTAASELGGKVTGVVIGGPGDVEKVVENAKK
jgi:electron transfer flavoprotein alpha subunit